jgi:hypothetical protein
MCVLEEWGKAIFIHLKQNRRQNHVILKPQMYFSKFLRTDLVLNRNLEVISSKELPLRILRPMVTDWVFFCNCGPISHWR